VGHGSDRCRTTARSDLEFLGNILLLIVGGNDTTRNSISGGVLALNQLSRAVRQAARPGAHPQHGVGDHPLADAGAHMRRTALADTSSAASTIRRRATRW
jgi:cytochrome P450